MMRKFGAVDWSVCRNKKNPQTDFSLILEILSRSVGKKIKVRGQSVFKWTMSHNTMDCL